MTMMTAQQMLSDIHALEEELLAFERKYGLRSDIFHAAYARGEEPEQPAWMLDFIEWASVYRTWLTRQAFQRQPSDRRRHVRLAFPGAGSIVPPNSRPP